MLTEKEKFGVISIKQFYFRRILRIWPLYYFILVLGFFILPLFEPFKIGYLQHSFEQNFYPNLMLYIFILPNLAYSFYPAVPNIGQAWSIGVEEQFYIFWPIIIAKSKSIIKTLLIITASLILIKVGVLLLGLFWGDNDWYKPLKLFVAMSKFECMSIGGLGAYFLYTQHKFLKLAYNPVVFIISLSASLLLIYFTPQIIQDGIHLVYSVLFLQIILFVTKSKSTYLDNKLFNYLGKISYGLYMYHFMVIPFCIYLYVKYSHFNSLLIENIVIYSSTILITILISSISYQLFEKRFIKMKLRHTLVKSGEAN